VDAVGTAERAIIRASVRLWRGQTERAREDLAILQGQYRGLDPQQSCVLYTRLADAAVWEDQLDQARNAAEAGLERATGSDDLNHLMQLCRAAVAVEVAIAQQAMADGRTAAADEARERANAIITRAYAAAKQAAEAQPRPAVAELVTAEAERSRMDGPGDPARWSAAVQAWDDLSYPWPASYARWRLAEAMLATGMPQAEVRPVAFAAYETAGAIGARRLANDIAASIDRAGAAETANTRAALSEQSDGLGLTVREREVIALLAEGLSNRDIAQALYISVKTASVHVSNILSKLGLANRTQAAAAAHRLGLTKTTPPQTTGTAG
jgi:DNA-binding CsgD family transcriptional regulator